MSAKNKIRRVMESDRALVNSALSTMLRTTKGPRMLIDAMKYSVLGRGKRIRSILTIESARAVNGKVKEALPFACAIELAHNFSLIHDDLPAMDDDNLRRGKLTCHKKFSEGLAILAGDGLLNLSFAVAARAKHKNALKIISLLSDAIGTRSMMGGQALDIYNNKKKRKIKTALKNKIDKMKTAALMAAACKIGGCAARASAKVSEKLYRFGINLGLAFQAADDMDDCGRGSGEMKDLEKRAKYFIAKSKNEIHFLEKKGDALRFIGDAIAERAKKIKK